MTNKEEERDRKREWKREVKQKAREKQRETLKSKQKCLVRGRKQFFFSKQKGRKTPKKTKQNKPQKMRV